MLKQNINFCKTLFALEILLFYVHLWYGNGNVAGCTQGPLTKSQQFYVFRFPETTWIVANVYARLWFFYLYMCAMLFLWFDGHGCQGVVRPRWWYNWETDQEVITTWHFLPRRWRRISLAITTGSSWSASVMSDPSRQKSYASAVGAGLKAVKNGVQSSRWGKYACSLVV